MTAAAKVLGDRFVEEFLSVLDELSVNPLLHCRRHPHKNIRWRYPRSFPYRVIYEVLDQEKTVIVAAGGFASEVRLALGSGQYRERFYERAVKKKVLAMPPNLLGS